MASRANCWGAFMQSRMRRVHVYNIDHDYALGDNSCNYTPPKAILKLRNQYACFPALFANPGDYILYLDSDARNLHDRELEYKKGFNVFSNLIKLKGLSFISLEDLAALEYSDIIIEPWGWDNALISKLERYGVPRSSMTIAEKIELFRIASSRFTAQNFFEEFLTTSRYAEMDPIHKCFFNREITFKELDHIIRTSSCEDVLNFYRKHKNIYVKAPWSSSGRGLIFTDELNEDQVAQWVSGIIRKQGGVVMEKAYQRSADFSSEWILTSGEPQFIGFGMFTVSSRGKYKSNAVGTSEEIKEKILNKICAVTSILKHDAELILNSIIRLQNRLIRIYFGKLASPEQSLPLGIDMFLTSSGTIHPCVEINLRNTMGHVALSVKRQILNCENEDLKKELTKFVAGNEISLPKI